MPVVRRASIFLKDHGLDRDSWARRLFLIGVDLSMLFGLYFYVSMISDDWTYWQKSPTPFHIFMVVQYCLICMAIRIPLLEIR